MLISSDEEDDVCEDVSIPPADDAEHVSSSPSVPRALRRSLSRLSRRCRRAVAASRSQSPPTDDELQTFPRPVRAVITRSRSRRRQLRWHTSEASNDSASNVPELHRIPLEIALNPTMEPAVVASVGVALLWVGQRLVA